MTTLSTLPAAPAELLHPHTRKPRFGTYVGSLPPVDFGPTGASLPAIVTQGKRWLYVIIASDEVICCAAVIRTGYASNTFAFVVDRHNRKGIADMTAMGPTFAASVGRRAGEGAEAKFGLGSKQITIDRPFGNKNYFVNIRGPRLKLEARLSTNNAPPPLSVICQLADGRFSTTEKGALLEVEGSLVAGSRKFDLKGAWGGYDYTAGLLERHTGWRWGFGMGRSSDGKPLAYNLTEGFVGERECVVWRDGTVSSLGAAHFSFDAQDAMQPWRVQTRNTDVGFSPAYAHREEHELFLVRSRFLQVGGDFQGQIVLPNETVAFDKLGGVTEDQDTLW